VPSLNATWIAVPTFILATPRPIAFWTWSTGIPEPPCSPSGTSDLSEEVEVEFGLGDVETVRIADRYRQCVDPALPHRLAGRRVRKVRGLDLGTVFRRSADGADLGFDADPAGRATRTTSRVAAGSAPVGRWNRRT
jgi:hypothetical protein